MSIRMINKNNAKTWVNTIIKRTEICTHCSFGCITSRKNNRKMLRYNHILDTNIYPRPWANRITFFFLWRYKNYVLPVSRSITKYRRYNDRRWQHIIKPNTKKTKLCRVGNFEYMIVFSISLFEKNQSYSMYAILQKRMFNNFSWNIKFSFTRWFKM